MPYGLGLMKNKLRVPLQTKKKADCNGFEAFCKCPLLGIAGCYLDATLVGHVTRRVESNPRVPHE